MIRIAGTSRRVSVHPSLIRAYTIHERVAFVKTLFEITFIYFRYIRCNHLQSGQGHETIVAHMEGRSMLQTDNNSKAYAAGEIAGQKGYDRDAAFNYYREDCRLKLLKPGISASVCYVAGYLGNPYPSHDNRVTS